MISLHWLHLYVALWLVATMDPKIVSKAAHRCGLRHAQAKPLHFRDKHLVYHVYDTIAGNDVGFGDADIPCR